MNFKKVLEAAKMPAALLVGIGILGTVLSLIPVLGIVLAGLLGLLSFFILTPLILAWAGYGYAKKNGLDYVGGALTGAAAGVAAAIVNGAISLVLSMLGLGAALGGGLEGAAIGAVSTAVALIGLVVSIGIMLVGGLIMGAVGAFLSKHIKI